jgi:hypothetical protein
MKAFSDKRLLILRQKLSFYGSTGEICGYLTPVEIAYLCRKGMRIRGILPSAEMMIFQKIRSGDSFPRWVYFSGGPHNPEFVSKLPIKRPD